MSTGTLLLPSSVTIDNTINSVSGIIRGVANIDIMNGGTLELSGAGRSFGLLGRNDDITFI